VHPVLIKLGPVSVQSWGFMLAVAVILSILGISRLFAKEGYNKEMVLDMVIIMVISGLIGGRLLYILLYERELFLANPLMLFSLSGDGWGGLVWYGGFLGGFLAFITYLWKKKLSFWKMADIFAPFVALGYAVVRIGCFLAGCCYGRVTDLPIGVVFPVVDDLHRHPTQLYSSALNFILFAVLLWFYPRKKFTGQVFSLYLMGYAIYRFFVEFFRDNLIMYDVFSLGQVYTLILLIIAAGLYLYRKKVSDTSTMEADSGCENNER